MSTEALPDSNPNLISDLFAMDPLALTQANRRQIIEFYRKNRAQWVLTGKGGPKAAGAKPAKESPTGKIDLSDIGL